MTCVDNTILIQQFYSYDCVRTQHQVKMFSNDDMLYIYMIHTLVEHPRLRLTSFNTPYNSSGCECCKFLSSCTPTPQNECTLQTEGLNFRNFIVSAPLRDILCALCIKGASLIELTTGFFFELLCFLSGFWLIPLFPLSASLLYLP